MNLSEQLQGARYRNDKLIDHFQYARNLPDDDPEKWNTLIFGCQMLRDILNEVLSVLSEETDRT